MGYISWYLRSQRGKRNTVERGKGETRRAKMKRGALKESFLFFDCINQRD